MNEIFFETLYDNLKLFPFLLAAYLFLEWLEHKTTDRTTALIKKSKKSSVFFGALLGILPQCGFSAVAANFYAVRLITLGTLIAVFISCSDEMLPLMISSGIAPKIIFALLFYKCLCAVIFGFAIDFFLRHKTQLSTLSIDKMCRKEGCHCEDGIFLPALHHAVNITLFVFLITLILNFLEAYADIHSYAAFLQRPLTGELLGALIGLIPNCSASALLTQLYIDGYIGIGVLLSGSLSGAGIGLLVLFRINRHFSQNLKITMLLYICGVLGGLCGHLCDFLF